MLKPHVNLIPENPERTLPSRPESSITVSMTLRNTVEVDHRAIWKARTDRKITLDQLHDLTDIPRTTLHSIENGRRPVTEDELARIAKALKVKPGALQ